MSKYRLLIVIAFIATFAGTYTEPFYKLEESVYNLMLRFIPAFDAPSNSVVVALDDEAIRKVGEWPWSRKTVARLVNRIDAANPSAIGLMLPLTQPQTVIELSAVPKANKRSKKNSKSKTKLDVDQALVDALKRSEKVILPYPQWQFGADEAKGLFTRLEQTVVKEQIKLPYPAQYTNYVDFFLDDFTVGQVFSSVPLPQFLDASESLGYVNFQVPLQDKMHESLIIARGDSYIPSMSLLLAHQATQTKLKDAKLLKGQVLSFAEKNIMTDSNYRFYPKIKRKGINIINVPVLSAADVLSSKKKPKVLKDKIVVVGLTASSLMGTFTGPMGVSLNPAQWTALVSNAILTENYIIKPYWVNLLQRGLLLLIALYLFFLPAKLRGKFSVGVSSLIVLVLLNTSFLVLLVYSQWILLIVPTLFLILMQIFSSLQQSTANKIAGVEQEAGVAFDMLATNFQAQGKLDQAFDWWRRCPPEEALHDQLYHLALDFESRRQFSKALKVYETIAMHQPEFKDIKERRDRLKAYPETNPFAATSNGSLAATLVVDGDSVARPLIGRYQIEELIGQGAMGTVYKGIDPKIGRSVAIKTLPLSEEFDPRYLDEVRGRFFREAETAGRLSHPHIVTVYDVGEEHDLAYIAMDFIEGKGLDAYIHADDLLPIKEVFQIGIIVGEALEYAHQQGVVHRDVKPANIIYNEESKLVKVTDFGIACLTDTSRTKTGTVLGSPSYMSPEQLAGKKLDGRSDLFSLGVTLFQLFTGRLPFEAESMASLTYKITAEKPISIRKMRPSLPMCLTRIINKALEKDPKSRFQDGKELAEALKRCTG